MITYGKLTFILFFSLLLVYSCSNEENLIQVKENQIYSSISIPLPSIDDEVSFGPGPGDPCPKPEDFTCTGEDRDYLNAMFGDFLSNQSGLIEDVINCPTNVVTQACPNDCGTQYVNYFDADRLFHVYCPDGDFPCGDGVFSAAEQQEVIDQVVQFAVDNAPYCGEVKMVPVHYNIGFDYYIVHHDDECARLDLSIAYRMPCPGPTPLPSPDIGDSM